MENGRRGVPRPHTEQWQVICAWTSVDYDTLQVSSHWLVYYNYENTNIVQINSSATTTQLVTYGSQGIRVSMMSQQ